MERISKSFFNKFAESLGIGGAVDFADIYHNLRHAQTPYKNPEGAANALVFAAENNVKKIAASTHAGWFWRYPYGKEKERPVITDRLSLNVYPDKRMLEILDDIVADDGGRTIAYYKTSDNLGSWGRRHDPITVYFHGEKSPEKDKVISQVAREIQPFVRHGKKMDSAVKIGVKVGPGVYYDTEPNGERVKAAVDRITKFPNAYKEILEWLSNDVYFAHGYPNGMPIMSAGGFWILERFAEFAESRAKSKKEILNIASVKTMDRSTGINGKTRYFIPNNPMDFEKLKKLLDEHGTKTKTHDSKLFRTRVLLEEIQD